MDGDNSVKKCPILSSAEEIFVTPRMELFLVESVDKKILTELAHKVKRRPPKSVLFFSDEMGTRFLFSQESLLMVNQDQFSEWELSPKDPDIIRKVLSRFGKTEFEGTLITETELDVKACMYDVEIPEILLLEFGLAPVIFPKETSEGATSQTHTSSAPSPKGS